MEKSIVTLTRTALDFGLVVESNGSSYTVFTSGSKREKVISCKTKRDLDMFMEGLVYGRDSISK